MTETAAQPTCSILVETHIEASPALVWRALTEGISAWWPPEFYAGGTEGERSYHLEPELGGRMYETWDSGGGLVWGRVVTLDPERKLQVTGYTFPEYGGPSVMFATWELEESDGGCALRFTEVALGETPEGAAEGREKGWTFLFDRALKAHVEGKPAPKWEE